jgi:thiosulfate/3-mercaptopyruvate sulfurtransferase
MGFAMISFFIMVLLNTPAVCFELQKLDLENASKIENLIFLDARPVKIWKKGHIPNARSFSWESHTHMDADGIKYRALPPDELAKALGKMGISHTDPVAVYADADTSWGGEGWAAWVLAWIGHKGPVYILDGGFSLWQSKGYSVEKKTEYGFKEVEYITDVQHQMLISAAEIEKAGDKITLIDNRNYFSEWLPGHLPEAVNIPWDKFYTGKHRQIITKDELKKLLTKKGVNLDKPVVYYCTGGIRSGFAWMVHELSGIGDAKHFEGGTEEWNKFNKK